MTDRQREISRRELVHRAGLVGVGALGAGLIGCRGRPDDGVVDTSLDTTSVQKGGVFSGRVVGLLGGAAAAGVSVRVVGFGEVETGPSGDFQLRVDEAGDFDLRIGGPGFHTRETAVRIRDNVDAALSILEVDATLPLGFLDQFARATGPNRKEGLVPRTPGATNRWLQVPVVRIFRRLQDRPKQAVSDARLAAMQASVSALFGPLTGNRLGAAPAVEVRDGDPPQGLGDVPQGVLAIVQRADALLGAEHTGSVRNPWAITKAVTFCATDSPIELFNRMFAHALGGWVVQGGTPSILNPTGAAAPTARDRAAATFLYARRPGNTAPDQDPEGTFIDA